MGCPSGALHIAEDKTVQHSRGLCIGCGACTWNCPYGAVVFSKKKGIAQKCDSCIGLREKGQDPACVQSCITQCLTYGTIGTKGDAPSFLPPWQMTEPLLKITGLKQREKDTNSQYDVEIRMPGHENEDIEKAIPFSMEQTGFRKDTDEHFVVIGNGIAGVSAAAAVRARNKTCSVTLLGDEDISSYSRPMLTKAPLRGFDPSVFTVLGNRWYEENRVGVIESCAAKEVDCVRKSVLLDDGRKLGFDRLIFATGARSVIPQIPGSENEGVFSIRTVKDMKKIRLKLLRSKNVVLIGGGIIGLETAWELKKAGYNPTVIEAAPTLMMKQLDRQSARILEAKIQKEGVKVFTGIQVKKILGEGGVTGVLVKDGTVHDADMVIFCCGVIPNLELAETAGAECERGILVNENMLTSLPGIYACGDCIQYRGTVFGAWPNAREQGKVAGANAAGDRLAYDGTHPSMLFNGIETGLYAQGDTGRDPRLEYKTIVNQGTAQRKGFFVNQVRKADEFYEKYFFADGRLVGGVLMGDLGKMITLQEAISQNIKEEEFLRIIEG